MKKYSPFIAAVIATSIFSFLVLAYTDHRTRQTVISVLVKKEQQAERIDPLSLTASVIGAVDTSVSASIPTATTSTTSPSAASALATTSKTVQDITKYQYKLLRDVDPCTLNKLGAQGWQPIQYGGNLEYAAGSDENCQNSKIYDSLDWALFSREKI